MKFVAKLCVAASIVLMSSAFASAHYHHVVAHAMAKLFGVGSGSSAAGATAVGVGQGALAVAIVWCAANQPKRNWRRDTWVDNRARLDYDGTYNAREDGCVVKKKKKRKRDPNTVSVRG